MDSENMRRRPNVEQELKLLTDWLQKIQYIDSDFLRRVDHHCVEVFIQKDGEPEAIKKALRIAIGVLARDL